MGPGRALPGSGGGRHGATPKNGYNSVREFGGVDTEKGGRSKPCACMCACMARSIRVEVYLPPETIEAIDEETDNRSEWIRHAVDQKLGVDDVGD